MSNYIRVIPRDLFNEAMLLKCLGALALEAMDYPNLLTVTEGAVGKDGFDIQQDQSNGSISCANVILYCPARASRLYAYTPLNSRLAYPLYITEMDDEENEPFRPLDPVTGKLTREAKVWLAGKLISPLLTETYDRVGPAGE